MFIPPIFLLKLQRGLAWSLEHWRAIAVVFAMVFIVMLTFYINHLRNALDASKDETDKALQVAAQNAATALEIKRQSDEAIQAIVTERDKAVARVSAAQKREREILNVPQDQDGAVAPVLRQSLDRLRQ
jgi:multidrug efflux pump subunit AcrB